MPEKNPIDAAMWRAMPIPAREVALRDRGFSRSVAKALAIAPLDAGAQRATVNPDLVRALAEAIGVRG